MIELEIWKFVVFGVGCFAIGMWLCVFIDRN